MVKAIIFDMDGLMIDSERVTYDGYVIECEKLGLTMDKEFYKKILGHTIPEIYQQFYGRYGQSFPMEQVLKRVHTYMADLFQEQGVPLKKGLVELLAYLKTNGYQTVVATSSTRGRVDTILEQAKLSKYFDASICGDEVEKGKPNPEVFLKACQKVRVEPEKAIVLEDSEAGIQAAFAAGIPVICVPDMKYPEEQFAKKASKIVDSLSVVLEMFRSGKIC